MKFNKQTIGLVLMFALVAVASVLFAVPAITCWAIIAFCAVRAVKSFRPAVRIGFGLLALTLTALALFAPDLLFGSAGATMAMAMAFHCETQEFSWPALVTADLLNKEGQPVEGVLQTDGSLKLQLLASGISLGVLFERLEGSAACKVHTRGPIRRMTAAGTITAPAYVKWASSAGVTAASSADKVIGIALMSGVSGDKISVMMVDTVMP